MIAYLHIGAGKTGTSAIQVALAQNRARLAAAGIHYPEARNPSEQKALQGRISSGNAVDLARLLGPGERPADFDEAAARAWVQEAIAGARGSNLVFSSELLQAAREPGLRDLAAQLGSAGYRVKVIFYARHLLDHALSAYTQHLKQGFATYPRHLPDRSRSAFLRNFACPFPGVLGLWHKVFGYESLLLRVYEQEQPDVVGGFFRLLNVAPPAAEALRVNRSPTPAEEALLQRLAQEPDGVKLCRRLTDQLFATGGGEAATLRVAPEDFEAFRSTNGPIVGRLNALYFTDPGRQLQLKSDAVRVERPPEPTDVELLEAALRGLTACLRTPPPGPPKRGGRGAV